MVVLKVLTLNCWGIELPFVTKFRHERIAAIGDIMGTSDYDIIFLQEVWSNSDYKNLCDKLAQRFPFSHYFHSGAIGSGVCIFSKFKILETLFHRFQINGFPHKIQHGDWFGGKGMGMCQIQVEDFKINLYITHLHAEYSRTNDIYLAHRVSQSFESSQFIKHTSQQCDMIILGGDLNLRTDDLGYKFFISTAGLADSWINKKSTSTPGEGKTCDRKDNIFTSTSAPDYEDGGQRIDYLLYRYNTGCRVSVEECNVLLHDVPGQSYRISDHEAVTATFLLEKAPSQGLTETITAVGRNEQLEEGLLKLQNGINEIQSDRKFLAMLTVIFIVLLYSISCCDQCLGILSPLATFVKVGLIVAVAFCIIYGAVIKLSEKNALYSTKLDMLNLLGNSLKT